MPSDFVLKSMNAVHRTLLGVTGGRVGWNVARMPVLELTTTGRKTGQRRSVMLTSPWQVGPAYVVVASRGGDDHHPGWFLNLQADPQVEISIRGQAEKRRARVASAEERAELWPQIAGKYRNYAGYQKKTDREIPLVFLEVP